MNTPDKALELFSFIENNYDVNKINYHGINVWPLLRKEIGFNLYLNMPFEYTVKQKTFGLSDYLKFPYRVLKSLFLAGEFSNSIKDLKVKNLMFAHPHTIFIDTINGKKYSRFLDPYYEEIKKKYEITRFSIIDETEDKPNFLYPVFFLELKAFRKYMYCLDVLFPFPKHKKRETNAIKQVFEDINKIVFEKYKIKPVYSGIIKQFDELLYYKKFTDVFVKKNKQLKSIFMECFYDTFKMALTISASEMGIKTVEIQHGGAEDFVYVPYKISNVNYTILPDYFWCWSNSDKDLIEKHNPSFNRLKPFVGGNMWLKKFINKEMPVNNDDIDFLRSIKEKYPTVVLICLQQEIGFADVFIKVIEKMPAVFFLVRTHPLTSSVELASISEKLKPFKHAEMKKASSIALYNIFNYVDLQLTHSSTTAMEALSFKVPTVICSAYGYDYYKEQISEKVLFYSEDYNEIVEMISQKRKPDFKNVEYFLIQTDESKALSSLSEIL